MIKTKFVFAVSFVAMMAVGTGHAEIAGVSYVEEQVGVATTAANNAQTSANAANAAAGNAQTSADNAQDAADAAQESADAAAASAKAANDAVALKQDKLTAAQLDAVNSGITSAKVSTYDGYAATIAGKQDQMLATEITTAVSGAKDSYYPSVGLMETSIATANNDVMDSVNSKQDALTTTQLAAVNSGITSAKVSTYDGYAATIAGKQATISDLATIRSGAEAGATAVQPGALAAVATSGSYNDLTNKPTIPSGALASKSTITNADVADDAEIAQSKISGLTTALSGKQATLTAAQLDAVNSGITSAKVSTYDGYATTIAGKQATISDLATIRSGAEAGATAVQPDDLAAVATTGSYNDLTDKPTIPSGALASKSTITNADVADDAEIAQSKISGLTTALSGKQATISDLATIRSGAEAGATAVQPDDLAEVATTGSYNDLTDKPEIPSGALASKSTITNADVADDAEIAQSKISGLTAALSGKQETISDLATIRSGAAAGATAVQPNDLAAVATSGSYDDLTGKPTIPTVNNATLTIKNGATNTDLATFTANQSSAATATIPAATPSVAGLSKIGVIPSGSATSTEYATIWVE